MHLNNKLLNSKNLVQYLPANVGIHDALLLLQYASSLSHETLFFEKEIKLSEQQFNKFEEYLQLRSKGVPVSKIVGYKPFYNNEFRTTEDTLDPRPETELIVDLFLKYFPYRLSELSILDLGCGTGCIGLSIIDMYPNATLCLADISDNAIAVARDNAIGLNLIKRCSIIKTDWFRNINGKFNAIVCNPPYVEDTYNLDRDTLYDPHIALFGGKDGLDAYRKILPIANEFLYHNGLLFLEIGINQCNKVCNITNGLAIIEIEKDLQGIERTIVFKNKK